MQRFDSSTEQDEAPPATLGHFLFYDVWFSGLGTQRLQRFGPVHLEDQFGALDFDVTGAKRLGVPANKNVEGVKDNTTHLFEYETKLSNGQPEFQPITDIRILNQCNDLTLEVKKPMSLLLPINNSPDGPPPAPDPAEHNVDHFLCYDVKAKCRERTPTAIRCRNSPKASKLM